MKLPTLSAEFIAAAGAFATVASFTLGFQTAALGGAALMVLGSAGMALRNC